MDLRDSPDEAAFRARARAWLAEAVPAVDDPAAARARWFDRDFLTTYARRLHAAGYAGLGWPVEYGGRGLPLGHQAIFLEESARRGATEQAGVIGLGMVGPTVVAWGTPAQRAHYLPGIMRGDLLFCQGFSEAEAGSDLAAVATTARLDGDAYVVDGQKLWSSYAAVADHCLLLARTGGQRHRGLTCLLVDLRTPGVTVRPLRQITGRADFAEISFDGARVPAGAVLGEPGDGFRVAMTTLAHERGTFGFTLTARLEEHLRQFVALLRACPLADDPGVRDRLAVIWTDLAALRWTNLRLLAELAEGGEPGPRTSVVKLLWSQANQRLAHLGAEVAAADERATALWRDRLLRSRGNTIEGGTSEVLRDVLAERVLGLPRSR
ncbi:acyl-CoA dehydrogenase family protein [Micromonospora sp. Mcm103]|uniref:acyl-CoA dehydrogenase family protein n=1 Tax=Micromonospora sp. Mcm103 TaxID=2926015 RepID=UPI0021C70D58|nr:acyl-CoA dehydrogenase family protein [Micromonospora sp. Mcm103]